MGVDPREPLCYQLGEQLSEQVNEPLDQPLSETGEWELVWLLLHKDSPGMPSPAIPGSAVPPSRPPCCARSRTSMRSRNVIRTRCSAPCWLSSSALPAPAAAEGEGQRRGERLALRLELLLKEALTEPWDIARMAGALHLSERQLYRLCQQHFALAPMALLQRLRLQRAALLLASRADSVKLLAEQCGFKNEYHSPPPSNASMAWRPATIAACIIPPLKPDKGEILSHTGCYCYSDEPDGGR